MCGIVGVIGTHSVNQIIFDALLMLQHRGQDAAGIATSEGKRIHLYKRQGLVVEAIRTRHMMKFKGNFGIGHVRYPTQGSVDQSDEAQPFYINSPYGIVLAHNGNLINTKELSEWLEFQAYRHLNTASDSEVLLNLVGAACQKHSPGKFILEEFFRAMQDVYEQAKGGYAVVGMIADIGLFAFRDPYGIRPLMYGSRQTDAGVEYMFASESVALDCDGFTLLGDVLPGEVMFVDKKTQTLERRQIAYSGYQPCIFEYVYLARPDSVMDGVSVYASRISMGRKLAQKILESTEVASDIDVVIPVPDSGRHASLPLADELGVVYREGFVKNRYIGRTFIMSNQTIRQKSIRKKLNTINHEFEGKHVLLVDDSIVRGNTSRLIVEMARAAGARKVSLASCAPPIKFPNVYGIDMPTHHELIAYERTLDEVRDWIGVDYLFYQTLEDLKASVMQHNMNLQSFETSVFDGKYVTEDIDDAYFSTLKAKRLVAL